MEQPKPEIADRSRRQRAERDGHPWRHWRAPAEHDDHGQCGHGTDHGDGGKADPVGIDLPSLGTELEPALHTAESQAPQPHRERRSEENTSELQSLMRNTYAVLCLKHKKKY